MSASATQGGHNELHSMNALMAFCMQQSALIMATDPLITWCCHVCMKY